MNPRTVRLSRVLSCAAFASTLALAVPATSFAALGDCGQPATSGDEPTTLDALVVLQASVGLNDCELCICDVNSSGDVTTSDALSVLRRAVGLPTFQDCPGCLQPSAACPWVAQFALFAKIRGTCSTNAECAPFSSCDTSIGRCRTATDQDIGWNGLAHDADIDDPIPARLFVECDAQQAPCGECEITGHDPSLGDCRCDSDNRTLCFTVAGPDQEHCGGGNCTCYFGPPMPLSSGNTPVCVLNTLAAEPTGTGNVDEGSGTIRLPLSEKIYLGASLLAPCPICANDPTPADGVRGGVCVGGKNDTESCDAQAYNSTFPPPTGALYSLDCFPLPGADISLGGLPLVINLTTGHTELTADLPCAEEGPLAEQNCPCLVCSGDSQIACHSHQDCIDAGAGSCNSSGDAVQVEPNACPDYNCVDSGGNDSFCAGAPSLTWCDALTRADGGGLIGCGVNADCSELAIGINAGNCTLVEPRACFPEVIESDGQAHPLFPLASGTYCSPPTAAQSVNTSAGLPGPGRLTLQTALTLFCPGGYENTYTPGVGGCPEEEPQ